MKETEKRPLSWFWKWFLNNQAVTSLLVVLLVLLILFMFTKVSYLFEPIWQFLAIVGLPIILAGILYYLMNPAVDYLERKGIKRIYSIFGLFILVIGLIVWGVVVIVPKIQEQSMSFVENLPGYLDIIENKVNEILSDPIFSQVQDQLEASNEKLIASMTDIIQNLSRSTIRQLFWGRCNGGIGCHNDAVYSLLSFKRWTTVSTLFREIFADKNA